MAAVLRAVLLLSLVVTSPLPAELIVGPVRRVSPPHFEPIATNSNIVLTESAGVFLATWNRVPNTEAVRLDRDGDPLDVPPLSLGPVPYGGRGVRLADAAPDGSGWLMVTRGYPDAGGSALVIERIAREGGIALVGEIAVPRSFGTLDIAGSDGAHAVLFALEGAVTAGIVTLESSMRHSTPLIVDGIAVGLAANGGRFAALFRDRVLIVRPDGTIETTVALPPLIEARAVAPVGDTFAVAATRGSAIVILRLENERAGEIASIPASDFVDLALGSSGEVLLVGFTSLEPGSAGPAVLSLARVGWDGSVEGPVARGGTAMALDVEGEEEGWLVGWTTAGPEAAGIPMTLRIDRDEPLAHPADDVDPVVWKEALEGGLSIAVSGDVALGLWLQRESGTSGALFDARGLRVSDEMPFPIWGARVAGRNSGFLVYGPLWESGSLDLVAFEVGKDGTVDPAPIRIAPITNGGEYVIHCAPEICLAAWQSEGSVRIARIRGSEVLDPGGVPVAFQSNQLAIASDGSRFLLASMRSGSPDGAIAWAALIDPREGLDVSSFDVLATVSYISRLRLGWNGSAYELLVSGTDVRIARITPEGTVIEGPESGWGGWPLPAAGLLDEWFRVCGTSYIAATPIIVEPLADLYAIEGRNAALEATLPLRVRDVACFNGGSCLAISDDYPVTRPPTLFGVHAFVVPMTCARERLVGR